MRKYSTLFAVLLIVLILVCMSISAAADFGDFSSNSDYGGGYSGGSDYGSSIDIGGLVFLGGGGSGGITTLIIVIGIIAWLIMKSKKGTGQSGNRPAGASPTTGLSLLDTIYSWDSGFSADEVKQRLSKLYVQMQHCWTAKDLAPLRGDFTDEQFAQFDRQLSRYRDEQQTNMIERISVLDVNIKGVKQDLTHDILVAELYARITDYTVDDKTGSVIRGSKNAEKFIRYEWTLIRPKGSQTAAQDTGAFNCPNCGAAMEINKSAQCPYCGSIVSKSEYDWVVAGIKGLSQQTK